MLSSAAAGAAGALAAGAAPGASRFSLTIAGPRGSGMPSALAAGAASGAFRFSASAPGPRGQVFSFRCANVSFMPLGNSLTGGLFAVVSRRLVSSLWAAHVGFSCRASTLRVACVFCVRSLCALCSGFSGSDGRTAPCAEEAKEESNHSGSASWSKAVGGGNVGIGGFASRGDFHVTPPDCQLGASDGHSSHRPTARPSLQMATRLSLKPPDGHSSQGEPEFQLDFQPPASQAEPEAMALPPDGNSSRAESDATADGRSMIAWGPDDRVVMSTPPMEISMPGWSTICGLAADGPRAVSWPSSDATCARKSRMYPGWIHF